jgi:RNA polymerase sigma-70 factor, ECF subfamily
MIDPTDGDNNPLCSDAPAAWDRLIEAVGPASLLAVIDQRMSAALKRDCTPEDVFQEALLHAWRDRERHEWRGVKCFRNWLLTVIDHRIHDLADQAGAQKRGGGRVVALRASADLVDGAVQGAGPPLQWDSTTPSRIAVYREQAEAMRAALAALPDDVRDVARLRLFDQLSVEDIAARLNLGVAAVRHRFRKGAELYQRRLMAELATRSLAISQRTVRTASGNSSPTE